VYKRYSIIDDILIEDIILENNCIKEDGLYLQMATIISHSFN
jgi:hypothetical protein